MRVKGADLIAVLAAWMNLMQLQMKVMYSLESPIIELSLFAIIAEQASLLPLPACSYCDRRTGTLASLHGAFDAFSAHRASTARNSDTQQ